ncbi:MAG: DUF493 family protein [Thermodesulfobacteriota bacterium]
MPYNARFAELQAKLDELHDWPDTYLFKFIVPKHQAQAVCDLFEAKDTVTTRPSRKGTYISVTATTYATCSEEIIAVYQAAEAIEGLISL